jgi:GT2 family glycosyltransferase
MDITAILVNYNDRSHLTPCLTALRNELGADGEIIVVDNDSADGSREFLRSAFPAVRTIANAENRGFGAANNQALAEAGGRLVLFLNTDTAVRPGSLDRLAKTLEEHPAVVAVGPALVHPDGTMQVSFGRRVSFPAQLVQKFLLNPFHKHVRPRGSGPRPVGWLSAACLLARKDAVREIGGFDEKFFLYFEDIDLCRRLAARGGRLLFEPRAEVLHVGGATTSGQARRSRLEYRRSQLYFYSRHAPGLSLRLLRSSLRVSIAAQSARGRFRGPEGRDLKERFRSLLRRDPRDRP